MCPVYGMTRGKVKDPTVGDYSTLRSPVISLLAGCRRGTGSVGTGPTGAPPEIARRLTREEYTQAVRWAEGAGLTNLDV
jgi:hypothetical protein